MCVIPLLPKDLLRWQLSKEKLSEWQKSLRTGRRAEEKNHDKALEVRRQLVATGSRPEKIPNLRVKSA